MISRARRSGLLSINVPAVRLAVHHAVDLLVPRAQQFVVVQERQRITDWNTTLTALREQEMKLQG